ncbi:MAG TPA: hypothetical protein VI564_07035 [Candidatus Nanoarchaeia archaeon]|nr:hypothetical protein [Candidatus Nanoarchaeia archaeon]
MNTQINLRLPQALLSNAKTQAEKLGYGNVQEFIKETLREKLFEEPKLSKEELELVKKLAEVSIKKNLLGTEEQLFKKLRAK